MWATWFSRLGGYPVSIFLEVDPLVSAATAVSIIPLTLFAGTSSETEVDARVVGYQRKKIAQLSNLKNHEPVYFQYPDDGPNSVAMLVKADIECGRQSCTY